MSAKTFQTKLFSIALSAAVVGVFAMPAHAQTAAAGVATSTAAATTSTLSKAAVSGSVANKAFQSAGALGLRAALQSALKVSAAQLTLDAAQMKKIESILNDTTGRYAAAAEAITQGTAKLGTALKGLQANASQAQIDAAFAAVSGNVQAEKGGKTTAATVTEVQMKALASAILANINSTLAACGADCDLQATPAQLDSAKSVLDSPLFASMIQKGGDAACLKEWTTESALDVVVQGLNEIATRLNNLVIAKVITDAQRNEALVAFKDGGVQSLLQNKIKTNEAEADAAVCKAFNGQGCNIFQLIPGCAASANQ